MSLRLAKRKNPQFVERRDSTLEDRFQVACFYGNLARHGRFRRVISPDLAPPVRAVRHIDSGVEAAIRDGSIYREAGAPLVLRACEEVDPPGERLGPSMRVPAAEPTNCIRTRAPVARRRLRRRFAGILREQIFAAELFRTA